MSTFVQKDLRMVEAITGLLVRLRSASADTEVFVLGTCKKAYHIENKRELSKLFVALRCQKRRRNFRIAIMTSFMTGKKWNRGHKNICREHAEFWHAWAQKKRKIEVKV